jgi:hypothetical protein
MVAGEPGLSSGCRLSRDDSVRRPRNCRTEDGRRFCEPGLVGDRPPSAASLVRPRVTGSSGAAESSDGFPLGEPTCVGGRPGDLGVGCDERGPLPGVGGRGVSGGESSGAGIEVPSVSEKLMGASVNGLNLAGIAAVIGGVPFSSITRMNCVWSEVIARRERQEDVSERCRIADGRELREGRGEGVRQGLWDGARTVVCTTRGTARRRPTAAQGIRAV